MRFHRPRLHFYGGDIMKNKRFLSLFVIMVSVIISSFIFSACQGDITDTSTDTGDVECAHEWENQASVAPTCDSGGYSIAKCELCDKRDFVEYAPLDHSFTETYDWDFDRGIVEATMTCSRCNKFYSDSTNAVEEDIIYSTCKTKGRYTLKATFILNGREYVDKKEVELPIGECIYGNYLYSLVNDDCSEGYNIYGECIVCGKKINTVGREHELVIKETVNLADFGACGGTATRLSCPCGFKENYEIVSACRSSDKKRDESTSGNVDGKWVEKDVYSCYYCGLETVVYSESIYTFDPYTLMEQTLKMDGEEIFKGHHYRHEHEGHKLTTTRGEPIYSDCALGYIETKTCNDCDYVERSFRKDLSHNATKKEVIKDLGEHGTLYLYTCLCGKRSYLYHEQQPPHWANSNSGVYECAKCDFKCIKLFRGDNLINGEMWYFAVLDENGEVAYEYSLEE